MCLAERAYITHPTESRIIQEKVVGMSVVYTCENRGLPVPVVSWYYNGASTMPEGITVTNESTLSISSLQVNHSGIYQCFVENFVIDSFRKDSRSWVLQVRSPSKCLVIAVLQSLTGCRGIYITLP